MKRYWRVISCFALIFLTSTPAWAAFFDWEKAVSLYKQGQFREAITEFQKVLAEYPEHSDSWKFVGLAYYQLKDYQSA
ncbi:MAG: tetratricopeptide repeat protein, partial [Acidobacteria bacterium]|nr:tetratricopeptide repeat protein [Acidobacteriota bacterium]